ncbi:hypothetical protein ACFV0D_21985 [Streptomyces sp. NPDC059556]|uniref:hypothetical protein n=1 Tax=Streptomyces sp. NPDC059556 TaxID=3346863 RepID=UPI00368958FD
MTSNASPSTISVNRRVLRLSMTGQYAGVLASLVVSVFQESVRLKLIRRPAQSGRGWGLAGL